MLYFPLSIYNFFLLSTITISFCFEYLKDVNATEHESTQQCLLIQIINSSFSLTSKLKFHTESIPNVIFFHCQQSHYFDLLEMSLIDKCTLTSKLILHHISKGCKPYLFRLNLNTYSSGSTLFHPFDFLACATLLGHM